MTARIIQFPGAAIGSSKFAKAAHHKGKARKSRLTNGKSFLPGVDHRSTFARRARDVFGMLVQDRGGPSVVSTAEALIARRASILDAELFRLETVFAKDGQAEPAQLCLYQTCANTQRRLLESIGLERRARDVTPSLSKFVDGIVRQGPAGESNGSVGQLETEDHSRLTSGHASPVAGGDQ